MDRAGELRKLVRIRPAEEDFLTVDPERCDGCAKCALVCPMLIWGMSRGKAVRAEDYRERCLECAGCFQICVPSAIRFRFPQGGRGVVVSQG